MEPRVHFSRAFLGAEEVFSEGTRIGNSYKRILAIVDVEFTKTAAWNVDQSSGNRGMKRDITICLVNPEVVDASREVTFIQLSPYDLCQSFVWSASLRDGLHKNSLAAGFVESTVILSQLDP